MTEASGPRQKNSSSDFRQTGTTGDTFLLFSISGQKAAVSLDEIKEVALPAFLEDLPNHINQVAGLMNLRGDIIPVIDLATKGGAKPHIDGSRDKKRVIVLSMGESKIGLLADNHMQVIRGTRLGNVKRQSAGSDPILRPYARSAISDAKGNTVPLLDNMHLFKQLMANMAGNVGRSKGSATVNCKEEVHHG